jgi:hypothetical protein
MAIPRGLNVRRRTEQFLASESGVYDVVLRGREIAIQPYIVPGDG